MSGSPQHMTRIKTSCLITVSFLIILAYKNINKIAVRRHGRRGGHRGYDRHGGHGGYGGHGEHGEYGGYGGGPGYDGHDEYGYYNVEDNYRYSHESMVRDLIKELLQNIIN